MLMTLSTSGLSANESLRVFAPPSIWAKVQGDELTGPIMDLIEDIFEEQGVSIQSVILPWARAMTQMRSGEIDMIPVIFYSEDRSEFMEFSNPYIVVPTSVFVPKGGNFAFSNLSDLVGKSGLVVKGDSICPEFESYRPQLTLTEITSYKQMLFMLGSNRADYVVAAKFGFQVEARKNGYEDEIEVLPTSIASRKLHIAFSKKSPYLKYLPFLNSKLEKMRDDGSLREIVEKTLRLAAEK